MLLLGAGFGLPLLGLIVGLAATRVRSPLAWWKRHAREGRGFAAAWPWVFAACLAAWLILSPGIPAASMLVRVDGMTVIPPVFFSAMALLLASVLASQGYDARQSA